MCHPTARDGADTVEEVASDATDQRLKRQGRLKAATQRPREVMLVWKLDCSEHCLVDGISM
jgi:hypothetical protein